MRIFKRILFSFLIIILALIGVFLYTTRGKPKVTIDYVAEYNRISRPSNYDPNKDASMYYRKAFEALSETPDKLRTLPWYSGWPTDFNDNEKKVISNWVTTNLNAIEYFNIAANKPYYWVERTREKNDLVSDCNCFATISISDIEYYRNLNQLLLWHAKFSAVEGKFESSFEDILNCYRSGKHKCRKTLLLLEQVNGLEVKQGAMKTALNILDKSKSTIDNKLLETFQNALQLEIDNDTYIPSLQAERYTAMDGIQRVFLDGENGRLAWSVGWNVVSMCSNLDSKWPEWNAKMENIKQKMYPFFGPTRSQTIRQLDKLLILTDKIMVKTPWQIKYENSDYLKEIKNINENNFFLKAVQISPENIHCLYYNLKNESEGLITVLAILRFKNEIGEFPKTLDELVSKGYLKSVPQDVYRNGSFIYKYTNDNFTLYSVGQNFEDDGGFCGANDTIFWPVNKSESQFGNSNCRCN